MGIINGNKFMGIKLIIQTPELNCKSSKSKIYKIWLFLSCYFFLIKNLIKAIKKGLNTMFSYSRSENKTYMFCNCKRLL